MDPFPSSSSSSSAPIIPSPSSKSGSTAANPNTVKPTAPAPAPAGGGGGSGGKGKTKDPSSSKRSGSGSTKKSSSSLSKKARSESLGQHPNEINNNNGGDPSTTTTTTTTTKGRSRPTAVRGRGSKGKGGGGSGSGRGRLTSSSLGRESLTNGRRSNSTARGGTVDPRASVAGGTATAAGTPGVDEDGGGGTVTAKGRDGAGQEEEEEDEDLLPEEDEDEGLLENLGEEEMRWREEMERIRGQAMGPLIAAMSEEQYDRHECYRRAGFNRANLRRLINTHLGGGGTGASVNPTMTMAFGGVAKVFVGEIIEGARRLQSLDPSIPPGSSLTPTSILESYRLYSQTHGESVSSNGLARGRANSEVVNSGVALGAGTGGKRRLF